MYRVSALFCLLAIAVFGILTGCSDDNKPVGSTPHVLSPQQDTIQFGQPTSFDSAGIVVTFDSVIGLDTRCPGASVCYHEPGRIKAAFTLDCHPCPVVLTLAGHSDGGLPPDSTGAPVYVDGYELRLLEVNPYPTDFTILPDSAYSPVIRVTPYDTVIDRTNNFLSLEVGRYWTYAETTYTASVKTFGNRTFEIVGAYTDTYGTWYKLNAYMLDLGYYLIVRDGCLCNQQSQGISAPDGTDYWPGLLYIPAVDSLHHYGVILEGDLYHDRWVSRGDTAVVVPAGAYQPTWHYVGPVDWWDYDVTIAPGAGVVAFTGVIARETPPLEPKTVKWWLLETGVR